MWPLACGIALGSVVGLLEHHQRNVAEQYYQGNETHTGTPSHSALLNDREFISATAPKSGPMMGSTAGPLFPEYNYTRRPKDNQTLVEEVNKDGTILNPQMFELPLTNDYMDMLNAQIKELLTQKFDKKLTGMPYLHKELFTRVQNLKSDALMAKNGGDIAKQIMAEQKGAAFVEAWNNLRRLVAEEERFNKLFPEPDEKVRRQEYRKTTSDDKWKWFEYNIKQIQHRNAVTRIKNVNQQIRKVGAGSEVKAPAPPKVKAPVMEDPVFTQAGITLGNIIMDQPK